MHAAHELSRAVRVRRQELGLTQATVARLSGLSRATISQVESGTLKDLSLSRTARLLDTLGLSLTISAPHPRLRPEPDRSPPTEVAARTASVSFKRRLTPEALESGLTTGRIPRGFEPHFNALLEEAPMALLSRVVEQIHAMSGRDRAEIWTMLRRLAGELGSRRDVWNVQD